MTAIADKPLTLGIARLDVSALNEIQEGQANDSYLCLTDPDAAGIVSKTDPRWNEGMDQTLRYHRHRFSIEIVGRCVWLYLGLA